MPRNLELPPTPRRPVPRIQLTLTLPHELVEQFDQVAERQDRSRSKMVEIAMRKYLVEEAAA